jgi:acyl transferase domain-containing protein/acyl carrier protein
MHPAFNEHIHVLNGLKHRPRKGEISHVKMRGFIRLGAREVVKKIQENNQKNSLNEPIAIIGMNCQFPGVDSDIEDVDAFYEMLINGQSPIKDVPNNRWDRDAYYDADRTIADKMNSYKGGFLSNPRLFDANFFKISSAEAKQIDPQHRLFLEVSVRALNHANVTLDSINGSNTGVYCGLSTHNYSQLNFKDNIKFNAYTHIGATNSAAVGRLCYFLNLKGPSMAVDTACSSSLSALYLAAMALRTQQCNMAIVGGVHLCLCPESFIGMTKANMLSATGRCSSFDREADGFASSEGCGVVIVKRLSDAIKDKNTIHAVIKSIVMNQDGSGAGLAAPNLNAQIAMHQAVLEQANLVAGDIDYLETHGTGTVIGDTVEFNAIEMIHQGHHSSDKPLVIGALKSNLGHTISASGIASLIKVICALKHEIISPNLHYSAPNKSIEPDKIPAILPVKMMKYGKNAHKKRRVQVSNLGFSGINVSTILEESPHVELNTPIIDSDEPVCFVLSANSLPSLKQMLSIYAGYLKKSSVRLSDICATLINCRDHYKFRCAMIANDKKELILKIESEDYALKKVVINKDIQTIVKDASQIYEQFLSGINIRLNGKHYHNVDLPLYYFDRKLYWHEPRKNINQVQPLEPIAIIGMSCRFPKAGTIDAFLALLNSGESGMADIPLERWDNDNYYDSDVDAMGSLYIKQLGLIDNVKSFDADFFNISPREAKLMSPQLRVLMEATYHALEDANLSLDSIKGSLTGVFIGCEGNEYLSVLKNNGMSLDDLTVHVLTGNAMSALPGRVAHAYDFHGPTQAIDTACSSATTAIHNACMSLQSGDCHMAIAGGVKLLLSPDPNITLSRAKMLSPDSRCKSFSEDADGYARSEGCGILVLKRLSTAIEDNDTILAVIKGSAINNDGKTDGFTVPNGVAQEAVIRQALARASLSPRDIDYIEAHGTGTPIADPIEMHTLNTVFGEHHSVEKPLYISSVKTNIGHCECASGVAGVIKAVLSLQTQTLFKHLNFKKLNPAIQLKNSIIPLNNMDWHKQEGLRRVGVNSFGFSGANAHVILQQAPDRKKSARSLPHDSLLVLSAQKKETLELLLLKYQTYLLTTSNDFVDICFTAATCRSHFLFRVAIKANTAIEAAAFIEKKAYKIHHIKKEEKVPQQWTTLEQLQEAYEKGLSINWVDYYKAFNIQFEKVKLPLYEFLRNEHWFDDKSKLMDAVVPKDWCFQLQWQYELVDKSNHKTQGNKWLLLGAKHMQASFVLHGLDIVLEEDNYPFDKLDGIIFAEGLDSTKPTDIDSSIEFQKQAIKKLLSLVQSLSHNAIKLQLIVLTTNAIAELAVGKLNLSNSPLIGFCKTLVLELPQYQTILIDLDKTDAALAQVVDEIKHNHGSLYEHVIAYRDGKRLVARLQKITLIDNKRSLSGEGRYLITGGCGGLGLVTAQALLSAGANELILISRTVDTPEIVDAIKHIKSHYPTRIIRLISQDVTDKESLARLFEDINSDGLLKGIIHAAGVGIKAPLIKHESEHVDYIFSAKVTGAWYLHELSRPCKLDFFVVYSSVSSVFGSNKESVYSASNSFLDVLIAERQRLGLVGQVIQWGPWGQVGMGIQATLGDPDRIHALITNAQGHALIKILLNGQLSHATIISPKYLRFMLDFVPHPMPAFHKTLANSLKVVEPHNSQNWVVESAKNVDLSRWLKEYFNLSDVQRFEACRDLLIEICRKILESSETETDLEGDEGFFEIGFDSLMIIEMTLQLRDALAPCLKLSSNIAFDYPSINKLSSYIESELNLMNQQDSVLLPSPMLVDDSIAIIGMSCSLPNAPNIAAFEALLEGGGSGMKDIPIERWDNSLYFDANRDAPRKSYVNKMGLMENIKQFDANFFGISPREAKLMDPQQRIFLENCYKALENANYHSASLRGSLTGVYAGVGPNEYYAQLEKSGFSNEELSNYSITGNVLNLIPGRVAYTFDFKGPSISVDTACSSSLVAIHYACQSLKNRETDYALAGGVNLLLMPESNITLCKANALAPDGFCKAFDEQADGYARAEGCGVIFLKRLSDAIRDNDTVLAVIKASAVNNDGKSAGLTVPSGQSQEAVMRKALSQTTLTASEISYIEAHGTGTKLGDPIEAHAINRVYGHHRSVENPLYIGTVKTNIGHLESASGVAGIIKTVIGLQNKKIYKHLNFNKLNPMIDIQDTRIALKTTNWNTGSNLKCAGVNAFGFSGTNAHVILQEFPRRETERLPKAARHYLLVISAKSKAALESLANRYQSYLETTCHDFGDICYTAATCREHYTYRLALVAENAASASRMLVAGEFALSHGPNAMVDCGLGPTTRFDCLPTLGQGHNLQVADYLQAKPVNWIECYKTYNSEFIKVALPHYTFDRSEFWLDKKSELNARLDIMHPLLGQMLSLPGNEYLFSQKLDLENLSYFKQHSVFDKVVFPATAYIEAGLAAAKAIFKRNAFCIEKFTIERPLYPRQGQEFQIHVKPKQDEYYKITIFAKQDDSWHVFSEMEIHTISTSAPNSVDINCLKSSFGNKIDLSQIYERFKERKLMYGEEFQVLHEGYVQSNNVLSNVVLTKATHGLGYYYHPVVLDGAMQSILLLDTNNVQDIIYIPYAFSRMTTFQDASRSIWVQITKQALVNEKELCVDVKLYDHSGLLISEIEGLKFRLVTRSNFISYELCLQHLYQTQWQIPNQNLPPQLAASVIKLPAESEPRPLGSGNPPSLPELLVLSTDHLKARKILGNLRYKFIDSLSKLNRSLKKNIVFIYEQGEFNALFHCCQSMFTVRPDSFILVTEKAYAIHDKDKVNPDHTMASSFWKSFRNELELTHNYAVDLDGTGTLTTALVPLFNITNTENQLAVRESIYVPRVKKKQLPLNQGQPETLFARDASYLITGGTGGLGKLLIEYLIQRGVQHIIITSRSECSIETKALIERAKQKQVRIQHFKADASNYLQMEQLIETIERSANPLKGVFHLAGVLQSGLIVNLTDEAILGALSAKMDSALILHKLTKEIELDVFVLFSSIATLLGARGQANYVAANGFLDGLAHLRRSQGKPAIAINWGPFRSIGMTKNVTQGIEQHGFIPIDKESIDILDVLLQSQLTQIAPCPMNWDIYFNHAPKQIELSFLVKDKPLAGQYFLNSLRQLTKEQCVLVLSKALCEITADVLGLSDVEKITEKDDLFSMGLDSLMAIDIRNRIHDKLQCQNLSLSIEYFISEPRIEKIAKNIADELQPILVSLATIEPRPTESGDLLASGIAEMPLCDFQYVFWVCNKLKSSFNIGMQLQLKGKLNKEYLSQAFEQVILQHSVFWLNFNEHAPTQTLKNEGKFNLIYHDISFYQERDLLHHEFYNNMMRIIPLTEQPLIRVFLYKINDEQHELHLLIPHIIVDDVSCEIVFSQFKKQYEAMVNGEKLIPFPATDNYFNFVQHNNHHYENNIQNKIDFWQAYNKDVTMLNFGYAYHLPESANQRQHLFHYPLQASAVEQFIKWHREKNLNVSSGLVATCQLIFHKMTRQRKIPIALIHNGREGSQYKSTVGLFSEFKRLNLTLNEGDNFPDCITSIEEQLLKTAPYQKCSYLIKNTGLKGGRLSIGQHLVSRANKFFLAKYFKESKLSAKIIDCYLDYFSRLSLNEKNSSINALLNKLFKIHLPLQKPEGLRVLISITPSFFSHTPPHRRFADLEYVFSSHYGSADRPIGNRTLWVYFSKNQDGEYILSINGPITTVCKEKIAADFNEFISIFMESEVSLSNSE